MLGDAHKSSGWRFGLRGCTASALALAFRGNSVFVAFQDFVGNPLCECLLAFAALELLYKLRFELLDVGHGIVIWLIKSTFGVRAADKQF